MATPSPPLSDSHSSRQNSSFDSVQFQFSSVQFQFSSVTHNSSHPGAFPVDGVVKIDIRLRD